MRTYDPAKFSMVVGGDTIVGYAPGTFIKAGRNEDGYQLRVGARGDAARVKNANRSGRFEITLMQESPSNDILSALAISDEDDGTGVVSTTVKDGSGTASAHGAESWVVQLAPIERGKEGGDVTWIIETWLLDIQQGGTIDVPGA